MKTRLSVAMKPRLALAILVAAAVAVFPQLASAVDFVQILPDGRVVGRRISSADSVAFFFRTIAGRSYSVEVVTRKDHLVSVRFAQTGDCPTINDGNVVFTRNTEPVMSSTSVQGDRVSFVATASSFFVACVTTSIGTPFIITGSVSDTTQFSPRWSTFGGFFTSWGFHNTTNTAITGTLTVIKSDGSVLATANFSIPAGTVVFRDTRATNLNLAANQAGSATFTHLGPPGAIQADAFFLNASATVVVPGEFRPVREATH